MFRIFQIVNQNSLILATVLLLIIFIVTYLKIKSNTLLIIFPALAIIGFGVFLEFKPEGNRDIQLVKTSGLVPSGQPAIVEFMSPRCMACLASKPTVNALEIMFQDEIQFIKINVLDKEFRDQVEKYGIQATPTYVLFDATGKETFRSSGVARTKNLKPELTKLVPQ